MNKELLLRVKTQIIAEPKQFVMGTWYTKHPEGSEGSKLWEGVIVPNCGTAACIAGWAIALQDRVTPSKATGAIYKASQYLDILVEAADDLFHANHWPDDLFDRWEDAQSLGERAQIAAERIDRFIAAYDK